VSSKGNKNKSESLIRYLAAAGSGRITRRQFLNGMAVAAGSMFMRGPGMLHEMAQGIGRLPDSLGPPRGGFPGPNGNSDHVIEACHSVWSSGLSPSHGHTPAGTQCSDPTEYDLIVIGGGVSGLSAAYFYRELAGSEAKVLILDNHDEVGGVARRNHMKVNERHLLAPQGSCYVGPPANYLIESFYERIGITLEDIEIPNSPGALLFDEVSHGVPHQWILNPYGTGLLRFPIPKVAKRQIALFAVRLMRFFGRPDWEEEIARLDGMTLQEHIEQDLGYHHEVTRFYSIECSDMLGLGADVISAAAFYWFSGGDGVVGGNINRNMNLEEVVLEGIDVSRSYPVGRSSGRRRSESGMGVYMFPGGNEGFARFILRALIPEAVPYGPGMRDVIIHPIIKGNLDLPENGVRLRLGSTAIEVCHQNSPRGGASDVMVRYLKDGEEHVIYGKSAVLAGGGYMTRHIVSDLPESNREALSQFQYSSYVTCNVFVNNTHPAADIGFGWFSQYYDGFGCACSVADGILDPENRDPDLPNCYTIWAPQIFPGHTPQEQGMMGRTYLISASFEDIEERAVEDLTRLFGPHGFSPENDIEGLFINRWGHSMLTVYPGFAFNRFAGLPDPVSEARQSFGSIAFAQTDVNGTPSLDGAVLESLRAVISLIR